MGATVDCEAIRSGLLAQPVNAITSLALVVAAAVVMVRGRNPWLATSLAAAGVGSFLFHGPLAPGGEWVHDVTLAWLILMVGMTSLGWERRFGAIGLAAIGTIFLLAPDVADPLAAALTVGALSILVWSDRRTDTLAPIALLAVSAIVGRLGATGGPLCNSQSVLQTHGLWHIGAATAVGWWAIGLGARADDRHSTRN